MSLISSTGLASLYSVDLTEVLLHHNPEAPFAHIGETHLESLRTLATMFQA